VFLKKDMTVFIDELCLFPDAAHDDTFDAFDFAVSAGEFGDADRFRNIVVSRRRW